MLFHKYCTAFYGSPVLPMFNNCMEEIYIAWRVAICRVWRVPWTTYCKLLPHLANCIDIELWFSRCTRFIKMAINSHGCPKLITMQIPSYIVMHAYHCRSPCKYCYPSQPPFVSIDCHRPQCMHNDWKS